MPKFDLPSSHLTLYFHRGLSSAAIESPLYADLGDHHAVVGRRVRSGVIGWSVCNKATRRIVANGEGAGFNICAAEAAAALGQVEGVNITAFEVED